MINLHNWLDNLVENFTFYGGGGKGKKGGGTSTTQQTIDPMLRPYVQYGLGEAQRLYQSATPQYYPGQTYVSPSETTQAALQAQQTRALAGNPLLPAAQQQQQAVIGGQYLANNPFFNQAMAGAGQAASQQYFDAINQAQSGASQAGRYGSGAQANLFNRAGTTLANTLANKAGELAYTNYAAERARQEAAAAGAPQLAMADYADIGQLAQVGQTQEAYQQQALEDAINRFNFEQNLPQNKLNQFLTQVYGAPQGAQSTTTQSSSGGGKIVCTAMNHVYGFGSFRNKIWLAQSKNLHPAYEKGYHTLFLPIIMFAYKNTNPIRAMVRNVLEHVARHRTADIWKQKRGKRDTLGRIYRAVLEPICFVIGKVKGA
jgi:hypothetical protein